MASTITGWSFISMFSHSVYQFVAELSHFKVCYVGLERDWECADPVMMTTLVEPMVWFLSFEVIGSLLPGGCQLLWCI